MNEDSKTLEAVQEFYEFLQGTIPEGIKMGRGCKPKLSRKKAFSIIWYLQEHFRIIPDVFEQCWNCGDIFDADCGGLYWESKGRHYCDGCECHVPFNYDRGRK